MYNAVSVCEAVHSGGSLFQLQQYISVTVTSHNHNFGVPVTASVTIVEMAQVWVRWHKGNSGLPSVVWWWMMLVSDCAFSLSACGFSQCFTSLVSRKLSKNQSKVNLDSCKVPLNTVAFSKVLRYGNAQFCLQTSHTCLYFQPQSITALWLVRYSFYRPMEGRRLSRPGKVTWPVKTCATCTVKILFHSRNAEGETG